MRFCVLLIVSTALVAACKTTRKNQSSQNSLMAEPSMGKFETEDQLPACDDINLGRVYWVRNLNRQMSCAPGGLWKPHQQETDSKSEPTLEPRGVR
jgi:hypothetical protein